MRIITLSFILLIFACEKEVLDIQLAPHSKPTIVCEGYITDQVEFQYFYFSLSTHLGSQNTVIPQGVKLNVTTTNQIVPFEETVPGTFKSTIPFAGISDEYYKIAFDYNKINHQVITQMPRDIIVHNTFAASSEATGNNPTITLEVSSNKDQYINFTCFKGLKDEATGDTLWTPITTPVYRVSRIKNENNQFITVPIADEDYFYTNKGDLIKIKTFIIHEEVGEYLLDLQNFINSALSNSKFYNPPYYFSNNAYGLAYGTIIDSTIIVSE
jgi:hypothetical protein